MIYKANEYHKEISIRVIKKYKNIVVNICMWYYDIVIQVRRDQ